MSNVINRPLPFNIEAEQAVLGSLMLDGDAIMQVLPFLSKEDFYRETHAWLYDVLVTLHERRQAADFVTIIDELERRDKLEEFGGHAALSKLMICVPTAIHLEHYARIVERDAKKRQLLGAAERIAKMVYNEKEEEACDLIERAEQEIFAIGQRHLSGTLVPIKEILGEFYKQAEQMFMDHQPIGLETGFTDLDRLLGGLQRGDLITLAARPGMGKTSLALEIVRRVAEKGATVAFFSLEMGANQLAQRLVSAETTIDIRHLRTGPICEEDLACIGFAIEHLSKGQIFIDQTAAISPLGMRAKTRRLASRHPLDLVVVDYLQLMSARGQENRVQEISYISRTLKELARELNVPLLALSQLSRNVEQRQDKRPILADLRGSGAIEQDSDIVIFIYRDDFYYKESETPNLAEIIVAKHRNGPTGTITLRFKNCNAKFTNLNPYPFSDEELEKLTEEYGG